MQVRPLHRYRKPAKKGRVAVYGNGLYLTADDSCCLQRSVFGWQVRVRMEAPGDIAMAITSTGIEQARFRRRVDAIAALEAITSTIEIE